MNNVTRINWIVLAYLAIWSWVDGFTMTAFVLTVLVSFEALWKPFVNSSLAVKLFGTETMAMLQQKNVTGRHQ
ncbi:hypothetical protein H0G69_06560 [Limosilactobacillus mucosae]|uniref:hypothetical protein n=1 Tax=Limosilactobacillus mucosae TaxID=97478 RepID=UPI0015D52531|nr:hypothetical protein [Limosilactobacillus mucosae]QLI94607.1 hypothetical protein H0G69_06560 [Limosilactobacillus mucosae]